MGFLSPVTPHSISARIIFPARIRLTSTLLIENKVVQCASDIPIYYWVIVIKPGFDLYAKNKPTSIHPQNHDANAQSRHILSVLEMAEVHTDVGHKCRSH